MGRLNIITLLVVVIAQVITGYLWYGPHLFGDVMTGHTVDFLRTDVTSLIFLILSSYGMTHVLDSLVTHTGTKDVNSGIKLGLTVGSFMLGFPVIMLLNLLGGYALNTMLVIFGHLVISTIVTTLVIVKMKK